MRWRIYGVYDKVMFVRILLFFGIFTATVLCAEELRVFTSTDGQKIEASVVNYNPADGKVVIRRADNMKFTVPYDRFSAEDQAYLDHWRKEYDRSFVVVEIMGARMKTSRAVIIIDESLNPNSTGGKRLIKALETAILDFDEDMKFNFICFSHAQPKFKSEMVVANDKHKHEAITWLKSGGTSNINTFGILNTFRTAMKDAEVEDIILISNGHYTTIDSDADRIVELATSRERPVKVYTLSFETPNSDAKILMRDISDRTGGEYHHR